jgi:hypothetical protein
MYMKGRGLVIGGLGVAVAGLVGVGGVVLDSEAGAANQPVKASIEKSVSTTCSQFEASPALRRANTTSIKRTDAELFDPKFSPAIKQTLLNGGPTAKSRSRAANSDPYTYVQTVVTKAPGGKMPVSGAWSILPGTGGCVSTQPVTVLSAGIDKQRKAYVVKLRMVTNGSVASLRTVVTAKA